LAQLEANLVADGCRDPLVLWGNVLIDGHNRFEICSRLGIPFSTVQMQFDDRDAACDWIDANQLGRRNLTPDQRTLMLGRRYNRTKNQHGGDRKSKYQNDTLINNAETIAQQHGVTAITVKRAGKYADAVAKVKAIESTGSDELKQAVRAGDVSINLASQLATLPKEKQAEGDGLCWRVIGRCCHDTEKVKQP
jgi:hypothetical protein